MTEKEGAKKVDHIQGCWVSCVGHLCGEAIPGYRELGVSICLEIVVDGHGVCGCHGLMPGCLQ